MFVLEMISDTITVPAAALSTSNSTVTSIHREIDAKYPNRVLMDVGLVIGRYERSSVSSSSSSRQQQKQNKDDDKKYITHVGHGVCVGSDTHYPCRFPLIVFRPFVNEVMVGTVLESSESGVTVSMGFFAAIHIPAYWMLNPSKYEESSGLWVWIPQYDDEDEEEEEEDENEEDGVVPKKIAVSKNSGDEVMAAAPNHNTTAEEQPSNSTRYEMELGAEIRFRVKSIHFTQVTATAKGRQAVTNATGSFNRRSSSETVRMPEPSPVRRRSSSVTLTESETIPSAMHIVASICEDGLGLTSWWKDDDDDEEEEGD